MFIVTVKPCSIASPITAISWKRATIRSASNTGRNSRSPADQVEIFWALLPGKYSTLFDPQSLVAPLNKAAIGVAVLLNSCRWTPEIH